MKKETHNILSKAWIVWHDGMLGYSPEYYRNIEDIPIVYADTPGKAKALASSPHEYDIYGEDHAYTDLRVRRSKDDDKILVDNKITTRYRIMIEQEQKDKINKVRNKINNFSDDESFYVQHGYVGNSILWWALNGKGYTTNIDNAHVFSKQDILYKTKDSTYFTDKYTIWSATHVNKHISKHVDSQHLSSEHSI